MVTRGSHRIAGVGRGFVGDEHRAEPGALDETGDFATLDHFLLVVDDGQSAARSDETGEIGGPEAEPHLGDLQAEHAEVEDDRLSDRTRQAKDGDSAEQLRAPSRLALAQHRHDGVGRRRERNVDAGLGTAFTPARKVGGGTERKDVGGGEELDDRVVVGDFAALAPSEDGAETRAIDRFQNELRRHVDSCAPASSAPSPAAREPQRRTRSCSTPR
jgi:hypothetical protein